MRVNFDLQWCTETRFEFFWIEEGLLYLPNLWIIIKCICLVSGSDKNYVEKIWISIASWRNSNPIVLSDLQLLLNLGLAFYFINPETLICELGHIHRLFDGTPQTPRFYPVHSKHSRPTFSPSSASLSSPNYSSISEFRTPRDDMASRDSAARPRKMSTTRMTFNVLSLLYPDNSLHTQSSRSKL